MFQPKCDVLESESALRQLAAGLRQPARFRRPGQQPVDRGRKRQGIRVIVNDQPVDPVPDHLRIAAAACRHNRQS